MSNNLNKIESNILYLNKNRDNILENNINKSKFPSRILEKKEYDTFMYKHKQNINKCKINEFHQFIQPILKNKSKL